MNNSAIELYGMMRKRIMTTMIGALASIEEFKDIFEGDEYEELRKDILDKGHFQIRELEKDIDNFEIKYKTVYFMPLRRNHERS
jgi:ribosome maturation protein Sdo1